MSRGRCVAAALVVITSGLNTSGCGGANADGRCVADDGLTPLIDEIDDALEATNAFYGEPQRYFEVSADLVAVSVIVAVDDATSAEQGYFEGGVLEPPVTVGEASGSTFAADAVDFDECTIFDRLRDELDDPVITDFAIQGGPDGSVIYDATVLSDSGGRLLVLLGPDGDILGAQAHE